MFFGGFGALSREIEALHKGPSVEESSASVPVPASLTILEAQGVNEGLPNQGAVSSTPEVHPPSGSAMAVVPWWMSSQAPGTVTAEGPLKLYRVTIEEISKGEEEKEKEKEDGVVHSFPTVSTTTTRTTTTTTQSVMLPVGMVEALLTGTAGAGAAGANVDTGHVQAEVQMESRGSKSQQPQQQHQRHRSQHQELPQQQQQRQKECERQGTVEHATRILNPARPVATAVSVMAQETVTDAAADTAAGTRAELTEVRNDASSVPVLVSKVKELSPSSFPSSNNSGRDSKLLVAADESKTVKVATQKDMVGLHHSQEGKEENVERDMRPWWQRRRDCPSAPHRRSFEDEGLGRDQGSNHSDRKAI
ncbi:hypothetical protein BGZ72_010480 [Mortierella alpina]|nr:hypothetical protein BGZ72_010480 [Mortierella alpina]